MNMIERPILTLNQLNQEFSVKGITIAGIEELVMPGIKIPVCYQLPKQSIDTSLIINGLQKTIAVRPALLNDVIAFFISSEDLLNPFGLEKYCTGYRRKNWLSTKGTVVQLFPYAFEPGQILGLPSVLRSVGAVVHELGHELDRDEHFINRWCTSTGWVKLDQPEDIRLEDGTVFQKYYRYDPSLDVGSLPTPYAGTSPKEDACESLIAYTHKLPLSENRMSLITS